jgi:hypothetical protein
LNQSSKVRVLLEGKIWEEIARRKDQRGLGTRHVGWQKEKEERLGLLTRRRK